MLKPGSRHDAPMLPLIVKPGLGFRAPALKILQNRGAFRLQKISQCHVKIVDARFYILRNEEIFGAQFYYWLAMQVRLRLEIVQSECHPPHQSEGHQKGQFEQWKTVIRACRHSNYQRTQWPHRASIRAKPFGAGSSPAKALIV